MSRRLGDDPLTRKKRSSSGARAVAVAQPTPAVDSPSYNKVFFEKRPESGEIGGGGDVEVELVTAVASQPEVVVAPPPTSASPPLTAPEPVVSADTPPAPASWTAQLVESVVAAATTTSQAPPAAPEPAPAAPAETGAPQNQAETPTQQQNGFFKRFLGRFQK